MKTDLLGKNPATTVVIVHEVNTDNREIGFDQVAERCSQTVSRRLIRAVILDCTMFSFHETDNIPTSSTTA